MSSARVYVQVSIDTPGSVCVAAVVVAVVAVVEGVMGTSGSKRARADARGVFDPLPCASGWSSAGPCAGLAGWRALIGGATQADV